MTHLELVNNLLSASFGMVIGYTIGYYEYPIQKKIDKIRKRRLHLHDDT